MYINIYCTGFLCGKKENGQALIKGWFLKHVHWVETQRRSNCCTCTARTGNARVASLDVCAGRPLVEQSRPANLQMWISPEFLEVKAASLLLLLLLQLHPQRERLT